MRSSTADLGGGEQKGPEDDDFQEPNWKKGALNEIEAWSIRKRAKAHREGMGPIDNLRERPCSKEEWRLTTNQMKRKTMANLGCLITKRTEEAIKGKEEEREDQNTPPPPPKSAQPPPKPPSTYASDKPRLESIKEEMGKGSGKEKGEEQGKKKGTGDTKGIGKSAKGKKVTAIAQTGDVKSESTSCTAQVWSRGIPEQQEARGRECYRDESRRDWRPWVGTASRHRAPYLGRGAYW